ncbi:MAG TPA: ImmA/IrrE family metallo-endopeptidase [Vicinamibacterales bacterium]|jgi:Zn-dependent peptidase ImmA (M78 family)|nr:ImmA/IrrE family metallo-endopeptidase [Vicinamibacterales bacterium]
MTVTAIRRAAERFVERVDVGPAPIDTEAIARAISLRIEREALDPDITGALIFTPAGPAVCINSRQSPHRQRVVLAHLIGHVQLHHSFPGGALVHVDRAFEAYRDERRYTPAERLEFEANIFAGTLLMPTRLVREHVAALGAGPPTDDAIQTLAARFGVSVQGMTLRLATAGLL